MKCSAYAFNCIIHVYSGIWCEERAANGGSNVTVKYFLVRVQAPKRRCMDGTMLCECIKNAAEILKNLIVPELFCEFIVLEL